jgi:hypothetical protein
MIAQLLVVTSSRTLIFVWWHALHHLPVQCCEHAGR